jgi:hypothetical protein
MSIRLLKVFLFFLILMVPAVSTAQFETGKNYLGPSLGLSFLGSSPQFGLNYEYGIEMRNFGNVGIGGIMRYWSYSNGFNNGQWSYTNFLIGAQGNYHFKIDNPKFDIWAGLVLAYDNGTVNYIGAHNDIFPHPSSGGVWLSLQGGLRYWVSNNFAVGGRLGFGTLSYSALEFGVDWKL